MTQTILIVEDTSEIRDFLEKVIRANNFNTLVAADGAEALKIIEQTPPDLVVLDFGLPKVSGETVCVEIKKNHPEIIVIVLTAKSQSSDIVHGLQIGADDYITKPFVLEELMARIHARLKLISRKKDFSTSTKTISGNNKINTLKLRTSIFILGMRIIVNELLLGLFSFIIFFGISFLNSYLQNKDIFLAYSMLFTISLIINIAIIFYIILKWRFDYMKITPEGIAKYTGILHKREKKYACNFIETITLNQSFLGLILNYGTLELYDPTIKEPIYLLDIENPKKNKEIIEKIIPNKTNQSMPAIAP